MARADSYTDKNRKKDSQYAKWELTLKDGTPVTDKATNTLLNCPEGHGLECWRRYTRAAQRKSRKHGRKKEPPFLIFLDDVSDHLVAVCNKIFVKTPTPDFWP